MSVLLKFGAKLLQVPQPKLFKFSEIFVFIFRMSNLAILSDFILQRLLSNFYNSVNFQWASNHVLLDWNPLQSLTFGFQGFAISFTLYVEPGQSKMRNSGEEVTQLRNQKEKIQDQQLAMLNWLLDSGFSYKVTTSLADLLSFVQNNTVDAEGNQKQLKGILTQSRNSFIQLISRLSQHFENTSASIGESAASPYERPSLAQSLLKGLHSAMVRLPADKRAVYVPVQVRGFRLNTGHRNSHDYSSLTGNQTLLVLPLLTYLKKPMLYLKL